MNGKVLEPSERVDLQTYGGHTTLDIPFSLRSDSGPYRLTLSNELGSDSAQATVTVLGQWSVEVSRARSVVVEVSRARSAEQGPV